MKKLETTLFAVALACLGLALVCVRIAWADVPLPTEHPQESIGLIQELWQKGQITQMAIVLSFMAITLASRKIAWFAEDHRAVYVSALVGGLAVLAEAAARGTTPTAALMMTAVMTGVSLMMNPKAPQQMAAGQSFSASVVTRPPRPPVEVVKQDDNNHPSASDQ